MGEGGEREYEEAYSSSVCFFWVQGERQVRRLGSDVSVAVLPITRVVWFFPPPALSDIDVLRVVN